MEDTRSLWENWNMMLQGPLTLKDIQSFITLAPTNVLLALEISKMLSRKEKENRNQLWIYLELKTVGQGDTVSPGDNF